MPITLTPEQEAWLRAHVAAAISPRSRTPRANSSTSASRARAEDDEDLAWAKPLVDEARDAVARGEFVSLNEHKAHIEALLESLKA